MASLDLNSPATPERVATNARRLSLGANIDLIRCVSILFALPNALFAATLGAVPATLVMVGCFVACAVLWRATPQRDQALLSAPIDYAALAGCGALALALCLLGGELHLFYANADWLARDGVLADLVSHRYPVFYRYQDHDYLLRAPLGMYMAPALVGRALGLYAAHIAMLAQNAALLASLLYFVAQLARPHGVIVVLMMAAFSGLDIVPTMVIELARWASDGVWMHIGHIEWWNPFVQYSSHVTQLFWAPNHALPGWWIAILILFYTRREIDFSALIAGFAPLLFWAPLPMAGAAPLLALFSLELFPRKIFAPRYLVAALSGLCFLPVAFFLTRDAGDNPHRLLLGVEGYWMLYAVFLLVEIPHALLLYFAWPRVDASDRRALMVSIALLIALPGFEFGHSNDLAMRASIPALFLLAFAFARVVAQLTHPFERSRLTIAALAIALLGAATPGLEIARSFLPAYAISDCNFLTTWRKSAPKSNGANYLAGVDSVPPWLLARAEQRVTIEDRRCWPEHPVLEDARK